MDNNKNKKCLKTRQKAGKKLWNNPWFLAVIVVLASGCDFITIFSVTEYYLTENVLINIAITLVIAFILNFLPSLLGYFVANKEAEHRKLFIILLSSAFVIVFALTFMLRWCSRGIMFEDTSDLHLLTAGEYGEEIHTTLAQDFLTITIGSSTFLTSLLSFVFSTLALPSSVIAREVKERQICELEDELNESEIQIRELEGVLKENSAEALDEQAYIASTIQLDEIGAHCKEVVKEILAEKVNSSKGVSLILNRDANVMD